MAHAQLETIIANPARKRKTTGRRKARKNMAKKMSLKQKASFGSRRVRAAAKAALKRKRSPNPAKKVIAGYGSTTMNGARRRKRCNPKGGGGSGRVITGYGSTVMNRAARKRKRNAPSAAGKRMYILNRARKRKNSSARKRKKNPGELIAITLGNPARKNRKRKNTVARSRKRKNSRRRSNPAGRRRTTRRANRYRTRRPNPGGRVMTMVKSGVSVIAGAVGTKLATQAVLGASNTGIIGYAANAVATGLAAWLAHAFTKDPVISQGIGVGGTVQIILRIINDYTPYGSALALSGLGDYQVAMFPTPSWYPNGLRSANPSNPWPAQVAAPAAVNSSGAGMSGWSPNWT